MGLNATARPTGSLSSQRFSPSNRVSQTMVSLSSWGPPARGFGLGFRASGSVAPSFQEFFEKQGAPRS